MGLGGALAYVLDPERGQRRIERLREKLATLQERTGDREALVRDLRERASGLAGQARGFLERAPAMRADLVERVRAMVGSMPPPREMLQTAGASDSARAVAGTMGGMLASAGLRRAGLGRTLGLAGLVVLLSGVVRRQRVAHRWR